MLSIFDVIIAYIMAIISFFTGFNINDVPINIPNEITTERVGIRYECVNTTKHFISGEPWVEKIEKNVDGEWEQLEPAYTAKQRSTKFVFPHPGDSFGDTCNFKDEVGLKTLPPGEYRLTVGYYVVIRWGQDTGKVETGYTSAVFTVKEA